METDMVTKSRTPKVIVSRDELMALLDRIAALEQAVDEVEEITVPLVVARQAARQEPDPAPTPEPEPQPVTPAPVLNAKPAQHGRTGARVWVQLKRKLTDNAIARLNLNLPARNVYRTVSEANGGRLTIPEIAQRTKLARKTVENSLIALRKVNAVKSTWIAESPEAEAPHTAQSHPMRRATDFADGAQR